MSNTINVNGMTSYYSRFIKSVTSQTSVDKGSKVNSGIVNGEKDSFISTLSSKVETDDAVEAMPVPSWYQAMGGPSTYNICNYGASKEEYSGRTFSVGGQDKKAIFDSHEANSFWSRRADTKKQIEEQAQKRAIKKKQMEEELAQIAAKKRYNHQQMMQDYYNEWLANNGINALGRDVVASVGTSNTMVGAAISSYEASFVTAEMM